jgi:hypothetical protein
MITPKGDGLVLYASQWKVVKMAAWFPECLNFISYSQTERTVQGLPLDDHLFCAEEEALKRIILLII